MSGTESQYTSVNVYVATRAETVVLFSMASNSARSDSAKCSTILNQRRKRLQLRDTRSLNLEPRS